MLGNLYSCKVQKGKRVGKVAVFGLRKDVEDLVEQFIPGGKVIECQKVEEPTLVLNRSKFGLGKKDVSKVVER
jgi:hypothetical protein